MEEGNGEWGVPTHYRFLGLSSHTATVPFDNVWTLPVLVRYTLQAHWGGIIWVQCRFQCGIPTRVAPSRTLRNTLTTLTEPLKSSVCCKSSISKICSGIVRKVSVSTKMKRDLKLLFLSWLSCFQTCTLGSAVRIKFLGRDASCRVSGHNFPVLCIHLGWGSRTW